MALLRHPIEAQRKDTKPHEGVAEMISPGSHGHGVAWGMQAWIDPVKRVA